MLAAVRTISLQLVLTLALPSPERGVNYIRWRQWLTSDLALLACWLAPRPVVIGTNTAI